jgi:hypothetical protein
MSYSISNLVFTDRGGFVNLNHTFPVANLTDTQKNPDLWTRAYKGAWMANAYTMLYYNFTNPRNGTTPPFSYVDSILGKTYPLANHNYDNPSYYDSLGVDNGWAWHLNLVRIYQKVILHTSNILLQGSSVGNLSSPSSTGAPPNPFNINQTTFSDIGVCLSDL